MLHSSILLLHVDRLNDSIILLSKLREIRSPPPHIVRIVAFWYSSQLYIVRWGTSLSVGFTGGDGVRQGGILSPGGWNFYMNHLSVVLNQVPAGCCSAGLIINHLKYADDLVVYAPSGGGVEKLLDVCSDYGQHHHIIYNPLKSNLIK